ncbi:MAG: diguanylate cyclase (GGDEF)-like protein [Glaciecola sp.]
MSLQSALKNYNEGKFTFNANRKVSFGFTRDVIWASVLVKNPSSAPLKKVFYLDSAWLDRAEFHFIRQSEETESLILGDTLQFKDRSITTRMPAVMHEFKPGTTQVLMRFESQDPLLIPIYLWSEEQMQEHLSIVNYFYGFLYGAFIILLVYNIALSLSLKDMRYIFYTLYLVSFLSLNIAYTGHGFKYIWPDSLLVQRWAMIFFLYCYIIFGIAFCIEFLKLNVFLPTLYRLKLVIYFSLLFPMISLFIYGDQLLAVMVGVALTSMLVIIFLGLGGIAYNRGHDMVKFFIPAAIMGAGGAAISAGTTWGIIPYDGLLFHSIEVGMLFEMFILALALAFTLKEVNKARTIAEINAQIDYLTQLYNRRAFTSAVQPQWHFADRNQKPCSIILVDIDWFKKINDHFGHAAGDTVLKSIASTLKRKMRKSDILARWGGEEFIIFLPNTDISAATKLASSILTAIQEENFVHEGRSLSITASLGVAEYSKSMTKLEDLIKQADVALYKAKTAGRNRVCGINHHKDKSNET